MDIRFKVNEQEYAITSDPYNIILNKVIIVKNGKTAGSERLDGIGNFGNVFEIFKYLIDREIYIHEDCTTLEGLAERYETTITNIDALIDKTRIQVDKIRR